MGHFSLLCRMLRVENQPRVHLFTISECKIKLTGRNVCSYLLQLLWGQFFGARWVRVVWDSTLCSGSSLYRKPVTWSIGEGGGALGALQHTQSMPVCMWDTRTPASGRNELVRRMCAACTSSHQLEHFVFFHHRSSPNTHHHTCAEQCVKPARMRLVFWHSFQILSRQSGWGQRGEKKSSNVILDDCNHKCA